MEKIRIEDQGLQESETEKLFRQLIGVVDMTGLQIPDFGEAVMGRNVQARVRLNDQILRDTCQRFQSETGIEISVDAQKLLGTVLNAVLSDPHPRWKASPQQRVEIVDQYMTDLRTHLATVTREEHVEDRITTFDLLHWVSRPKNFQKICIIDERRP